jgi:branched-chain amino acid aminotransferase
MKIYIDGQYYSKEDAKVSVFDHGFLYGDGIFEGIRAYKGRVFRLPEHIDRLYDSAKAILLTIPMSKEEMINAVVETCRANDLRDGCYIRLVVTRGVGDLGLDPRKCPKASVIIIASTIQVYPETFYENGLKLVTASTQRIPHSSLSPSVKSLNYLNNILAKIEGNLANAQEVVMLNHEGYVAECSADNIFAIKKGKLYTPTINSGALNGITRGTVLELAQKHGIPVLETHLTRYDLFVADELFLTGTGAEIIPGIELDARPIGDGKVGPITKKLNQAYRELVNSTGTPIFP